MDDVGMLQPQHGQRARQLGTAWLFVVFPVAGIADAACLHLVLQKGLHVLKVYRLPFYIVKD